MRHYDTMGSTLPGTVRADGRIRCSNCPCWRAPEDFVGVRGGPVRRCLRCRVKDDRQKQRPVQIERRRARHRERKYYIRSAAAKRGYRFDLADDAVRRLLTSACHYCGGAPREGTTHGIDRMDNFGHYTPGNCVACCGTCNMMKKCLDAATFVLRCRHIAGGCAPDAWVDRTSAAFATYRAHAAKRNLEFQLTREEFDALCSRECTYCRRPTTATNRNGVDRRDSSRGYVAGNCVPCCAECNQMKGAVDAQRFWATCRRIAHHWRGRALPVMDATCVRCITKRAPR